MKKSILLLLALSLAFACSKEQSETTSGDFSVSGKFLTPNGEDAVSKATVKLIKDELVIKETVTDSEGKFLISDLDAGDYQVLISKGLFSASQFITLEDLNGILDFDLENISITDLPNIAVVTGSYDNIETVLYDIGLVNPLTQEPLFDIIDGESFGRSSENNHNHSEVGNRTFNPQLEPNTDLSFADLIASPDLLATYDIIFLNCGLDESQTEFSSNLTNYVANGGLLYSTDYAFVYLDDITNNGEDYLDFYEPNRSGTSLSTEATIVNDDLLAWLDLNFGIVIEDNTVTIDQFLPQWQVVDSYNEDTVIPWLNGSIEYNTITEDKSLAYTFLHGDGGVLYASFHTKNNPEQSEAVARSIQYLVFELSDL
ncbi:carboxypeptidase-like regulatory domain-containing protein [Winogradskyella sp. UBA3174]|uniref:carboxypeptidase-like regulatory domain-containing protein n=1 Tax=Winogradskyella sp. UBA3174 TaxID=1947785 RepID=UPI0025DF5DA9|nr:carboxypeptidase-like regulatory domain-containing protein [Winogradskyella sp. UBA3174]|tara:strand:- start:15189 stop:16301 length:1113 start_codon:yes stop_codon:yes gene_type:complete